MYERPDVPKDSPHRNLIAIVILAVVAVAVGMLVSSLWTLANTNSAMGSEELAKVVKETDPSSDTIGAFAEATGLTSTGDDIETTLFVVTPDGASAAAVYLYVANETQASSRLMQLANDAWLQAGEENYTVADWYANQGAKGLAGAISSAAAVPVSHVVIMSETGWSSLVSIVSEGTASVSSNSAELIESIQSTDMDVTDLVDLAEKAINSAASVEAVEGVPTYEASDEAGNVWQQVDCAQLAVMVGTLA